MVDANPQENEEFPPEIEENIGSNFSIRNLLSNRLFQIGIAVFIVILVVLIVTGFIVRNNLKQNIGQDEEKRQLVNRNYKYVSVFEGVTPMDAAQIRKVLSYDNIPFESQRDGRVINISVPREYSDLVKLKMAQLGLPEGGIVGFEIFDESAGLGSTDYDRRIKYIRALSGELSRIMSTMENIDSARVQIVLPEKNLFGEKVPGSTSVILNVTEGRVLTNEQIKGIMHLVASSVENVSPENVTIIDNKGNILSEEMSKDAMSKQLDDFIRMLRVTDSNEESPLELLLKFKRELKENYEATYTARVKDVLKTLYPEGSYVVYTNVTLTESYKESTPFEIGKINIAIMLDNTNEDFSFSQEIKQSTFQLVASVVDYVRGRDSIVLELMPFVNIEATTNHDSLKTSDSFSQEEFMEEIEDSYVKPKTKNSFVLFLIFGLLFLTSGIIVFIVYFFTDKKIMEIEEEDEVEDAPQALESREEDLEFALEKFRSFVSSNEETVVKKIIKWVREDDV